MSRLLELVHVRPAADLGGGPPGARQGAEVPGFGMRCQEELQWCWAAVTQSIEELRGARLSQSEIASRHIDPNGDGLVCAHPLGAGGSGSRCHGCHADCGDPHSLGFVLDERGRLAPGGAVQELASFDEIRTAVDARRPLPVRIEWGGRRGHFVCVTGYAVDGAGARWVTVHDPLIPNVNAGPADDQDLRYSTFSTGYPATSGGTGVPNFTYKVQ